MRCTMIRRTRDLALLLLVSVGTAWAAPVLIAVPLEDHAQRAQWRDEGVTSFAFIAHTAIAETDESQLPRLRRAGFVPHVIDREPWSLPYFLVSVARPGALAMFECVWSSAGMGLVKTAALSPRLHDLGAMVAPLPRRPLPARVWDSLLSTQVPLRLRTADPQVQELVSQVSTDSLMTTVQRLQDFRTRLILHDSSYAASAWIKSRLDGWGYDARFDSFYVDGYYDRPGWPGVGYERNVTAVLPGLVSPSTEYIIGGHFDSTRYPYNFDVEADAPGADDNATGMSVTLEAARLFRQSEFDPSLRFMCWGAEESGHQGSEHHAAWAESVGADIRGVINLDMVGFRNDNAMDLVLYREEPSVWFASLFRDAAAIYTPALTVDQFTSMGADDWSYTQRGFPGFMAIEEWWYDNPNMHQAADTVGALSPAFLTEAAKAAIASMAILAIYPGHVADVAARDQGTGHQCLVTWSVMAEPDIVGYQVSWGTASQVYDDSMVVPGAQTTAAVVDGLNEGIPCYLVVRAMDGEDRLSFVATEVSVIPREIPLAPIAVRATPIPSGVQVDWARNTELDLAGYIVTRRMDDDTTYVNLTATAITDTTFIDQPIPGAHRYYYAVRAVDTQSNLSDLSAEAYGRPITMDQGILVVDETRNQGNPSDELQDAFYGSILEGYALHQLDYASPDACPVLADLVPYSTVFWHADDYGQFLGGTANDVVRQYHEAGGNVVICGWKPSANLSGETSYPMDLAQGDFLYDVFGVNRVDLSGIGDPIYGVTGVGGYPSLTVDPSKVPLPAWGGTLRYVEALVAEGATALCTIDTDDQSGFEGNVCGVGAQSESGAAVILGFPLYFMQEEGARAFVRHLMAEIGEPLRGRDASQPVPSTLSLAAGRPNPFSDRSLITFGIPQPGDISLSVYDIAGRQVRRLLMRRMDAGNYEVVWDARDADGREVPSGTYFLSLRAGSQQRTRKLLVLR